MLDKLKNMLSLDQWVKNFEGYLDARIELVKFDVKELMVSMLSKAIFFVAIAIFALAGLVCFNFGMAHLLSDLLGNQYAGFLILTGVYFLIAFIFYRLRNDPTINLKLELMFRDILKQPIQEPKSDDHEPNS